MTAEQKLIYQKVDEILWFDWDPIGINADGPRDEYSSYTAQVFSLKIHGAERENIANHLNKIATDHMGLEENIEHCREIADKILAI